MKLDTQSGGRAREEAALERSEGRYPRHVSLPLAGVGLCRATPYPPPTPPTLQPDCHLVSPPPGDVTSTGRGGQRAAAGIHFQRGIQGVSPGLREW